MDRSLARVRNIITALAVVTLGMVVSASPGVAEGNNGTVKIEGWTLDHGTGNGSGNRNEPHVDCTFDVEWYNYDAAVTSTVTFDMWPPTGDVGLGPYVTSVLLDNDDASGANEEGLDAVQPYELQFTGAPHPEHGYHVKLTVNTPISNGADVKHKVFWVEGCEPPPECPNGDLNGEDPGCEPPECPNGDNNGTAPGCDPPPCPNGDNNGPNFPGCDRPEQPEPQERRVPGDGGDCALGGTATWVDVYTTPYVWSDTDGWILGTETGPVQEDYVFTPYTTDEFLELCAPDQPAPETRSETGEREGCRLGGVLSWTDTWTTTYTWDEELGEWVGTETGPVRTEEFDEYTDTQFLRRCTDVLGEQEEDDDKEPPNDVEVAGEQATVPGAVNAGLGDALAPVGSERNPLWLLVLGSGLGLMGVAGWRRRPAADR